MRPLPPGTRKTWALTPGPEHTAARLGNEGVEVVASPFLIAFLEQTCHLLIEPCYEPGEATVGVDFEMRHVAAAVPGRTLTCRAELVEKAGRRLAFAVEAEQDGRVVMRGRHGRFLIDRDRFMGRTAPAGERKAARAPVPDLVFWFDVHSPWCYLASLRIGELARRQGARLAWRPLHLPRLLAAIGGRRPLEENPAFVAWYQQDLQDWAGLLGVELRYHPDYPLRNSRALRACVYAAEQGRAEAFARRLLAGYWSQAADISDIAVLQAMAAEVGLDPSAIARVATGEAYKRAVEENTQSAIAAGVFGVPTVAAAGKLFFGHDRLDLLERWLSRL